MRERAKTAEERLAGLLDLHALLNRVSREIGPALELGPVLTSVLGAMRSLVEFRGGTICLVDDRGVYIAATDPPVDPAVASLRVPVGTGLAGRVVSTGLPVYSADVQHDPRVDPAIASVGTNATMRSYLAVPLVCLGQVIGLLQVDSSELDAFDADDLRVLEGLAAQVAGAIESARRHEEMAELEALKSDFVARVTHELKTPLTIISGFAQTLSLRSDNLSDDQRAWLERIRAATDRLGVLIDELLTATSFEAGMMSTQRTPVRVRDVLVAVRDAATDPERVSVRCEPDDLSITTDPNVLRHVLSLLVDNALKYGGNAEVVAGRGWIAVQDRGPGVPEPLRERVFERFVRGNHTLPGMGLGLPIARNLAAAIGARVEFDDAPGGGARFTLHLG